MNVWFCSDLHFGHKNIGKLRDYVETEAGNVAKISKDWLLSVTKRDRVYVLGDACFTTDGLKSLASLPGEKILVRGNHDNLSTVEYLTVFSEVYGLLKYKEFWLSHAPIHPDELRGKVNLHGHVHYATIRKPFNPTTDTKQEIDDRYFNCCPENLWEVVNSSLISLNKLRHYLHSGGETDTRT